MAAFISFLKEFLENFEKIEIVVNPKSIEEKLYNLQEKNSLRRSTIWCQAEICRFSSLGFRNLMTSQPQI